MHKWHITSQYFDNFANETFYHTHTNNQLLYNCRNKETLKSINLNVDFIAHEEIVPSNVKPLFKRHYPSLGILHHAAVVALIVFHRYSPNFSRLVLKTVLIFQPHLEPGLHFNVGRLREGSPGRRCNKYVTLRHTSLLCFNGHAHAHCNIVTT